VEERDVDSPAGGGTQSMVDKQELADLLAVLSSAVDRADLERIASCYTDDSFDDHGTFKGSGREFAEFVCRPGPMSSMHHLLGQSVFEIDGDEAWGETFYVFNGTVGAAQVVGHGRYVDYFRRVGRSWKLAYRRVVPDAVPAGDDADAYWKPSRDRADPSYDRRRRPDERPID
jgi:ketosteroid isomerase-like protein